MPRRIEGLAGAVVERVKRRDRDKPCYRCGAAIRWDLPGTHPQGPTIDHGVNGGPQVADVVGMPRGEARRLLHDVNHLAVSHRECNTRDGRGIQRPPTAAPSTPAQLASVVEESSYHASRSTVS